MRFHLISLRDVALDLEGDGALHPLTEVDEYACYLYRCEGASALHEHSDHDELLWPQDHAIDLRGEQGALHVAAGQVARVPRGWKHAPISDQRSHVLVISRAEGVTRLNGHHPRDPRPPEIGEPVHSLDEAAANVPTFLLRCDTLHLYVERVEGTGPARHAEHDVLVMPTSGSVGIRCGGIVAVLAEREMARVPARAGWHLFGEADVVWMTPRLSGTHVEKEEQ